MKMQFHHSIEEVKSTLEKEKASLREAFQYVMNENSQKCDAKDVKAVKTKVDSLESALTTLSLENKILKDQIGQHLLRSNINHFEEDLAEQTVKISRLDTFNRELRSKVDYFISLLQNMNIQSLTDVDHSSTQALSLNSHKAKSIARRFNSTAVTPTQMKPSILAQNAMEDEEN